jgi:hypothetical protein
MEVLGDSLTINAAAFAVNPTKRQKLFVEVVE